MTEHTFVGISKVIAASILNVLVVVAICGVNGPINRRVSYLCLLPVQFTGYSLILYVTCKLPILNKSFPPEIDVSLHKALKYMPVSLFSVGIVAGQASIINAGGISLIEISTTMVICTSAISIYLSFGKLPSKLGMIVKLLCFIATVVAYRNESLALWLVAIVYWISCGFRKATIMAIVRNGPKIPGGHAMLYGCVLATLILWCIWITQCMVKPTGLILLFTEFPLRTLSAIILGSINQSLVLYMGIVMSPTSFHIRTQAIDVVLAFLNWLPSSFWTFLPFWVRIVSVDGAPRHSKDMKMIIIVKLISVVVYTSDRIYTEMVTKPKSRELAAAAAKPETATIRQQMDNIAVLNQMKYNTIESIESIEA